MLGLRSVLFVAITLLTFASGGCAGESDSDSDDIVIDTSSREARAQFDANISFASEYTSRCGAPNGNRPRVLISGFGRWGTLVRNPSGMLIQTMVRSAPYPVSMPPAAGQVDAPGPQLSVGREIVTLPATGEVDVCAMVLPTGWDLASILILKEMATFNPTLILMNGVAGSRQKLEFELGARNRAGRTPDNMGLVPAAPDAASRALVATAPDSEFGRPNVMSWLKVRDAALSAIETNKDVVVNGEKFSNVLRGAQFTRFPDPGNDFVCNNVTYVVGYAMDHPEPFALMQASKSVPGKLNALSLSLPAGFENVPRDFLHWPSALEGEHLVAAKEVLVSIIDAQLRELALGNAPTRADNAIAE